MSDSGSSCISAAPPEITLNVMFPLLPSAVVPFKAREGVLGVSTRTLALPPPAVVRASPGSGRNTTRDVFIIHSQPNRQCTPEVLYAGIEEFWFESLPQRKFSWSNRKFQSR